MTLATRMSRLGTESAFKILAKAKALEAAGHDIINLGIGAPDFRTPENIITAGKKALDDGFHFYTPAKGIPELREAVVNDIQKYRGVTVDKENVMIVPGGKPTMFFAISMFGEAGAEIMYPNPGFPIYESMIEFSGAKAVPIELLESNGFGFDPDRVLAQINEKTRLIILNTPANPTGGVLERDAIDRFVAGLEKHPNVFLLADEIYARLLYDGLEHVSFLEYESIRDRTILLDGWSKTYSMTGWRLGYGVWPAALIDHAERLQINSNSCPSAPVQVAGIEALTGPQDAVDMMLRTFDERRKLIVKLLNEVPGFSCIEPKGAFYAFPNITGTGIKSKELEELLLDEIGVATVSGTSFGHLGEGYIRFSYASSTENIETALKRIKDFMANRISG
ncbi:MAG: aspartate aminotransferase [SAR86 cluster bacterium]|uniref:Aspartate aminotransferase n=1 Tax=SAR86 cluster bacterium TaxID=2030880 RepID=A0A2A5CG25_9GAMM|nr:MAG: aspartate aminotransferase [SAR86 cluster bacterium]